MWSKCCTGNIFIHFLKTFFSPVDQCLCCKTQRQHTISLKVTKFVSGLNTSAWLGLREYSFKIIYSSEIILEWKMVLDCHNNHHNSASVILRFWSTWAHLNCVPNVLFIGTKFFVADTTAERGCWNKPGKAAIVASHCQRLHRPFCSKQLVSRRFCSTLQQKLSLSTQTKNGCQHFRLVFARVNLVACWYAVNITMDCLLYIHNNVSQHLCGRVVKQAGKQQLDALQPFYFYASLRVEGGNDVLLQVIYIIESLGNYYNFIESKLISKLKYNGGLKSIGESLMVATSL